MITALWGLRSTNNETEKKIYVRMRNNEVAETTKLVFKVCDAQYDKDVILKANSEEETSIEYKEKGNCVVVAINEKSGKSTRKVLDLDKPESR